MSVGPPGTASGELDRLRRQYESSLSWRLTRPLRAARRLGGARRPRPTETGGPEPASRAVLDPWLEHFFGHRLAAVDAACATAGPADQPALFGDLDDSLWAMLLTQQYERWPHIKALLPDVPEPGLQETWNGCSGIALASQSRAFCAALRSGYARHAGRPLSAARVLDFGCGWGRLTRHLARDVAPQRLYGCDPVQGILDVCRANGVAATMARSEFLPERVPFAESFDLVFAFSVFTHLSEAAHERCLSALHAALAPEGILVVTVRPPSYLSQCEAMHPLRDALGPDAAILAGARYLFVAHEADPGHPQRHGDAIDYGETVVTIDYVRERWADRFEVLDTTLLLEDPYQVVLTLGRV
jgi:SAM-dependent methyltransferase